MDVSEYLFVRIVEISELLVFEAFVAGAIFVGSEEIG